MKKILLLFFTFSLAGTLLAQSQLGVKSFKKLENDLDARVNEPSKDQNGDVCAIIKIVTTQVGFSFDSGQIGIVKTVQKPSEIWVYVPYGAKRITISHPQLGILRDYLFPQPIEKATVYELVLITGKVITSVEEEINSQWLVINPDPADAMIYLNDQFVKSGTYQAKLKPGSYSYRIEAPMYYTEAGKLEITNSRKEMNIKLKPAFGTVSVISEPEQDAKVIINGKPQLQSTPSKSEPLNPGEYTVQVVKEMFQPFARKITVKEGQETQLKVNLIPSSAELAVTIPSEASLYINNVFKSTGNWNGRLYPGIYSIEARMEHYKSAKQDIEVAIGDKKSVELTPSPIYGSLDVITSPTDVTIRLNNKEFGTTPSSFNKLLIGEYDIQLEKKGYKTIIKTVRIEESKNIEINEKLSVEQTSTSQEQVKLTENSSGETADSINSFKINKRMYSDKYYHYRGSKTFWLLSSLVFAGSGTLAYMQSKQYYQDYLIATTDADALHNKVALFSKVYPAALGIAGFSLVEFFIKSKKQAKAKKQPLSYQLFNYKDGFGMSLAYHF